MISDEFPCPPNVLLRHANIVRFECRIEYDLALLAIFDDMDMRLMPALIARIDGDAKAFDFDSGHRSTVTYTV